MEVNRLIKQFKKQSNILLGGVTPSAMHGRFVGPKVLVNSVPKSGTNLLQQLVLLLPLMRGNITRTLNLDNGSEPLVKKLSNLKKGQCAPGHIVYNAVVDQAIQLNGIRHVMIIRDFRDVLYSNIHYLDKIHTSHSHNKVFATLSSLDEKIQVCLSGKEEFGIRAWPDLIRDYSEWLNSKEILVIRYENLVSQDSKIADAEIHRIIDYLNLGAEIDVSEVRRKMFNPKGLTFNAPGIEKWKTNFNQDQIAQINQALGEELVCFGYEV